MGLRITTWNVNGIRNPFGYHPWREMRTFDGMFDTLEADIVVMQELKIQRKDLRDDMVMIPGWDVYFSLPVHKKGYSGVGIYTRKSACAPVRAEEGLLGVLSPPNSSKAYRDLPADKHIGGYLSSEQLEVVGVDPVALDAEGRCVILEFPAFVLFGLYSPANSSGTRDDFRHGFLVALDMRARNLVGMGKRVIVCGDLNVSREPLDTANSEENMRKEGVTLEEYLNTPNRRIFNQLLEGGKVVGDRDEAREHAVLWDVCRGFHPNRKGMFTHWEQKINARPGNFGSRIDFILCSLDMKSWFAESNIQEGLMGSDHCPVYAIISDKVELNGTEQLAKDLLGPPGIFQDGKQIRDCTTDEVPAFSAKLMPEFDKRRSIKAMFGPKPVSKPAADVKTFPAPSLEPKSPVTDGKESEHTLLSSQASTQTTSNDFPETQESISSNTSAASKKRAPAEDAKSRPSKLQKSTSSKTAASDLGRAQQSLKGFFKPSRPAQPSPSTESENPEKSPLSVPTSNNQITDTSSPASPATADQPPPAPEDDEPFIDPEHSKAVWTRLLAKPRAPLCEHHEPCKIIKTKKAGVNCGREFWMCQRPIGPSGNKEKNTEWRCPTFIWSSDWKREGEG